MKNENIFADAMPSAEGERFEALLDHRGVVIERIVSSSKIAPTTYVQEQDEWVVLLRGQAELEVDGNRVPLREGDYVFLPATTPHTVLSVSEGALWLAVHIHRHVEA